MKSVNGSNATWMRRLVGAAVPVLLVAGGVSVAALSGDGGRRDNSTSVAALGAPGSDNRTELDGLAPATSPATGVTPGPTTTAAPRAASSIETPPATQAAPATTLAPVTTTAPTTTAPRATTTTIPADAALVTFVNDFPEAVLLEVNGQKFELAPGQRLSDVRIVPAASNNDGITLTWKAVPTCGIGDAMKYFAVGQRFTFTVITGRGVCTLDGRNGPDFKVTPSLVGG